MGRSIRKININEYMPILIDLINKGNTVPLLISGNSMCPFLVHHRDTIFISKPNKVLKKGDIVFFIRKNGQYVVHRIHHKNNVGELFIIGDGQTIIEGPIKQSQVFGVIYSVNRKNKYITNKNILWKFFSLIWIRMVNYRKYVLLMYTKLVK